MKRIAFDEAGDREKGYGARKEITTAYPDGDLLVLGLLKGVSFFSAIS